MYRSKVERTLMQAFELIKEKQHWGRFSPVVYLGNGEFKYCSAGALSEICGYDPVFIKCCNILAAVGNCTGHDNRICYLYNAAPYQLGQFKTQIINDRMPSHNKIVAWWQRAIAKARNDRIVCSLKRKALKMARSSTVEQVPYKSKTRVQLAAGQPKKVLV